MFITDCWYTPTLAVLSMGAGEIRMTSSRLSVPHDITELSMAKYVWPNEVIRQVSVFESDKPISNRTKSGSVFFAVFSKPDLRRLFDVVMMVASPP